MNLQLHAAYSQLLKQENKSEKSSGDTHRLCFKAPAWIIKMITPLLFLIISQNVLAQCPSAPEVYVNEPLCGSTTTTIFINEGDNTDLQFIISTVGSDETITTSDVSVSLDVGHSYIIFSQRISSGCISATGTEITIDQGTLPLPQPSISLQPPACGSSTGVLTVRDPVGADYEYSDNGGGSYQPGATFTIAAGASYSITYRKISTGCISTATTGTMDPTPPPQSPIMYVNASANGLNNGTSWTNAYKNLQDALANAGRCVTQIWVAKGTYYPDQGGGKTPGDRYAAFVMRNNLAIYGGFIGTENDLSQRDWRNNATILSGDIDGVPDVIGGSGFTLNITGTDGNSNNVVRSSNVDNTAVLDGFTISGAENNIVNSQSGAMDIEAASPTVSNCLFRGNRSPGIKALYGSPHVNNCRFEFNEAPEAEGGGISDNEGNANVTNSIFVGNSATDRGGAVQTNASTTTFTNCVFTGNWSPYGGAISNIRGASPTFINCLIYNNSANDGGGMYSQGFGLSTPTVINCSFYGNSAIRGGALYSDDLASPVIKNSIFWGNGSEIFNGVNIINDASITNSIVAGGYPGTGNLDSDPLFNDATNGDFHLQRCSHAIDAGDDAANNNNTDLDGNNRKFDAIAGGALIDMGAYEYQSNAITRWYKDNDGDTYGDPATFTDACAVPTGYVANNSDCNDANNAVHPGAVEICGNGIDDNCNGQVDENCNVCGNATSLTTTNVTKNSATLNWTAAVNPVQWQVQYKTTNQGSKWVDAPSVAASARSVTISGLKSNQGYNWHIRAKCGKTWTAYSNAAMFKTTSSSSAIATSLGENPSGVKLYPNPNNGQFVIELNIGEKISAIAKIQLIDLTGRTVQTENAEVSYGALQKTINVSAALAKGIYMVRIVVNAQVYKTEMIYQK